MIEPNTPTLIQANEAAARLGVSLQRIYELTRLGLVPAVRLGRSIRFDPQQLEAYISDGGSTWPGGWRRGAVDCEED